MSERELSILVRAKGAAQAAKDIGKVGGAVGSLKSKAAGAGKIVGAALGGAAIIGAGLLGHGIKAGIESLDQLENATTSVQGAIDQMGLRGKLTADQVAGWANQIEKNVQSAFDDKDITRAAGTLIRFGKVTPANLEPAMQVMTDLAAKTGSVDSAATLLAKALADPEKAAGKLARQGVVLTKAQQDQLKAMMKTGDIAGAQAFLLRELAKTTTGAAAASKGPYADSLNTLRDVTEDAERALGIGFLPVIMKVRDLLSKELGKPQTIQALKDFGQGLAGGLDKLIDFAIGLPWGAIGDAFKLVGQGSKAALDLFTGLPPWVQTAVLTGWGLNKLTGGAVSSLVGSLASGLVKGVLGMTAGVVNINAGVVNGTGGIPTGKPAGGGGAGLGLGGVLALLGVGVAEVAIADQVGQWMRAQPWWDTDIGPGHVGGPSQSQTAHSRAVSDMASRGVFTADVKKASQDAIAEARTQGARDRDKLESMRIALVTARGSIVGAERSGTAQIVGAIHRSRPIVNVRVNVAKGDTIRVTKNYTSGSTIGQPGHARTGGQQEFN